MGILPDPASAFLALAAPTSPMPARLVTAWNTTPPDSDPRVSNPSTPVTTATEMYAIQTTPIASNAQPPAFIAPVISISPYAPSAR